MKLSRRLNCDRKTIRAALSEAAPCATTAAPADRQQSAKIRHRQGRVRRLLAKKDVRGVPKRNSSGKIAQDLAKTGLRISPRQVRRDLGQLGARYLARPLTQGLSTKQKLARVEFARGFVGNGGKLLFSDEKLFNTNDSERKQWVLAGEKPAVRQKVRWAPSVHVWGVIGVGFRYLHVLDAGSVTADTYIETLRSFIPNIQPGVTLQQDGAPAHKAHKTTKFLEDSGVRVLRVWPANSPDLSPVENMWSIVQREIAEEVPSSKVELERAIVKVWNRVPQVTVDALVLSFRRRLDKCVELAGEHVQA